MVAGEILDHEVVFDDMHLFEPVVAVQANARPLDAVASDRSETRQAASLRGDELFQREACVVAGSLAKAADRA